MRLILMVVVAGLVLAGCLVIRLVVQLVLVIMGERECPQCGEDLVERENGEWVCEGCGLVVENDELE